MIFWIGSYLHVNVSPVLLLKCIDLNTLEIDWRVYLAQVHGTLLDQMRKSICARERTSTTLSQHVMINMSADANVLLT